MTLYYWDKEERKFKEGYPPHNIKKFGKAPYVIQDTIDKYYHPRLEKWTESRSELKSFDKHSGTITTDKLLPADDSQQKERLQQLRDDQHKALHKAVAQIDSGTAPISEETKELCKRQNEIVASVMPGLDPWNAAGHKNNPKGKRYVKRK